MILKCVKKLFNQYTGRPYYLTVNKTYQCLPINNNYGPVLVYDDNHEWNQCPMESFAPVEPDPLIDWKE